jgi:hypothetical protein
MCVIYFFSISFGSLGCYGTKVCSAPPVTRNSFVSGSKRDNGDMPDSYYSVLSVKGLTPGARTREIALEAAGLMPPFSTSSLDPYLILGVS